MELGKIIVALKDSVGLFKKQGFSIGAIKLLLAAIVRMVEGLNDPDFKGKDKKELALNLLDECYVISGIDIPILSDKMERKILRLVAGVLINSIVSMFNKKNWK